MLFESLQEQIKSLLGLKWSERGPIFYFAYGSNMDEKQMKKNCPNAKFLRTGRLPEYRIDFTKDAGGYEGGVADVVADPEASVWGLIYELTKEDLKKLDEYETYPTAYYRFLTNIECSNKVIQNVWVYSVVNKEGFLPPNEMYMSWIRKAAFVHEFPEDYQLYLKTVPTVPPNIEK